MKNPSLLSLELSKRKQRLLKNLHKNQAILLSQPADITYFTGFNQFLVTNERETLAYLSHQRITVLHPHFTTVANIAQIEYRLGSQGSYFKNHLTELMEQDQVAELLVDQDSLFAGEFLALKKIERFKIAALDKKIIWQQRLLKSESELKKIRKAKQITQKTLNRVLKNLQVGISEEKVALILETEFKKFPHTGSAFPAIVAFGRHTTSPHHQPTNKKLRQEMPILIDCGAKYQGYCGDMTRTIWFGQQPTRKFLKIEKLIKKAYKAAKSELNKLKSGQIVSAAQLDQAARQVITAAGFGPQFTHTTGHGLGLEIHEPPSIGSHNQLPVASGMVITIEPGIYLKNKFGYRHENTIIVE